MSVGSYFTGFFNPGGQAATNEANQYINNDLAPGSSYWNAANVGDNQGILQGAAQLQNANIGYSPSSVNNDANIFSGLADTYGNISKNGGPLGAATVHQAQSDAANTTLANAQAGDRQAANTVLATDQSERNAAAAGKTTARSKVLGNMLQQQIWNMAVNHANFQAQLSGQAIDNTDTNLAGQLGLDLSNAAQQAHNAQYQTWLRQQGIGNTNAQAAIQMMAGAGAQMGSTISAMSNLGTDPTGNANTTNSTGYTSGDVGAGTPTFTSSGIQMPAPALGTTFNQSKTVEQPAVTTPVSNYVNPITGDTVNPNLPTDTSSWGAWLTSGSSLVSS